MSAPPSKSTSRRASPRRPSAAGSGNDERAALLSDTQRREVERHNAEQAAATVNGIAAPPGAASPAGAAERQPLVVQTSRSWGYIDTDAPGCPTQDVATVPTTPRGGGADEARSSMPGSRLNSARRLQQDPSSPLYGGGGHHHRQASTASASAAGLAPPPPVLPMRDDKGVATPLDPLQVNLLPATSHATAYSPLGSTSAPMSPHQGGPSPAHHLQFGSRGDFDDERYIRKEHGDDVDADDGEESLFFNRESHTGAIHYIVQGIDKLSGQKCLVPAEFTAKVGDVCVVRLFGEEDKHNYKSRGSRSKLAASLSSDSAVVEPKLTPTGAVMLTLGQLGSHTFTSSIDPDLCFTAHVAPAHDKSRSRIRYFAGAFLTAIFGAATVLGIVLWANSKALFNFLLSEEQVPNLHGVEERMESIFYTEAFPWYVVGTVFFFIMMCARVVFAFRKTRVHDFRRGFVPYVHVAVRAVTATLGACIVLLALSSWNNALRSNEGFTTFFSVLANGARELANDALATAEGVRIIAFELPIAFPGTRVPADADGLIGQVMDIASTAKTWSTNGEGLVRGAFRLIALVRFISMTVIMYGAAVCMIGGFFGNEKVTRGGTWINWLSLAVLAGTLGTTRFLLAAAEEVHELGVAITSQDASAAAITRTTGITDPTILNVVVACSTGGLVSPVFMNDMAHTIVHAWNSEAPVGFRLPNNFTITNLETIDAQITFLNKEILVIEEKVEENPVLFHSSLGRFVNVTAPLVRAALSVAKSALTISDCSFVRRDVANALPHLENGAIKPLKISNGFQFTLLALLIVVCGFCGFAAFVLRRPRKKWYCWTTKRWFRFRYSLVVHRTVNAQIGHQSKQLVRTLNSDFVIKGTPWCSLTGLLLAAYLFHHTLSMLQLLLSAVLLVLNFSSTANELPTLLYVCAFVMLVPVLLTPLEFRLLRCIPRVPQSVLRFLYAVLAMATGVMSISYAEYAGTESASCVQKLRGRQGGGASIYTGDCSAARLFWLVETSAYAAVVAGVCSLAFAMSLLLMLYLHRRLLIPKFTKRKQGAIPAAIDIEPSPTLDANAAGSEEAPNGGTDDPALAKMLRRRRGIVAGMVLVLSLSIPLTIAIVHQEENKDKHGENGDGPSGLAPYRLPDAGCNGDARFCAMRVDQLVWATSHNAMSSAADDFVAPNNFYPLEQSLDQGFRAFMIDVYPWSRKDNSSAGFNETVYECHGACFLGGYPMLRDLHIFRNHLEIHPKDVIVVFLEQYAATSMIRRVVAEARLTPHLWIPRGKPNRDAAPFVWPTLAELAGNGTRLIMMTDEPAGTVRNPSPAPAWLPFAFDFVAETSYEVKDVSDFGCALGRGSVVNSSAVVVDPHNAAFQRQKATVLNHFITSPFATPFLSEKANTYGSLFLHYEACQTAWGAVWGNVNPPNFVAVDFWSLGHALHFTADENLAIIASANHSSAASGTSAPRGSNPLLLMPRR